MIKVILYFKSGCTVESLLVLPFTAPAKTRSTNATAKVCENPNAKENTAFPNTVTMITGRLPLRSASQPQK